MNAATIDRRGLGFDGAGIEGRSDSDVASGWERRSGLVSEAGAAMLFYVVCEYNPHGYENCENDEMVMNIGIDCFGG